MVSVEKRREDVATVDYYVIELDKDKGRLMTPVEKAEKLGVRKPISKRKRLQLSKLFSGRPRKLSEDFRKRRAGIDERLRGGSYVEVGRVARDLVWLQSQSRASAGDRRLLQRAKQLLAEELAASDEVTVDEAMARVDAALESRLSRKEEKSD
jgi:CarD family transcriptional regulator